MSADTDKNNRRNLAEGQPERNLRLITKIASAAPPLHAATKARRVTGGEEFTDIENARRFVSRHGGKIRYVHDRKNWFVFDGSRWKEDSDGEIARLATAVLDDLKSSIASISTPGRRRAARRRITAARSAYRVREMLQQAQSDQHVAITSAALDKNLWLLNAKNGTIDLRTGQLRPHNATDLITR